MIDDKLLEILNTYDMKTMVRKKEAIEQIKLVAGSEFYENFEKEWYHPTFKLPKEYQYSWFAFQCARKAGGI